MENEQNNAIELVEEYHITEQQVNTIIEIGTLGLICLFIIVIRSR